MNANEHHNGSTKTCEQCREKADTADVATHAIPKIKKSIMTVSVLLFRSRVLVVAGGLRRSLAFADASDAIVLDVLRRFL